MTSVEQLLSNAHRRGFRLLGEVELVSWLRDLAAAGIAVETAPGEWQLTKAGRARFAPVAALDPEGGGDHA